LVKALLTPLASDDDDDDDDDDEEEEEDEEEDDDEEEDEPLTRYGRHLKSKPRSWHSLVSYTKEEEEEGDSD
jgi:hypothetical protein